MVSSTVGSLTNTGWKRRASAASFSTCLRYSSSVVAPMQCSSPRASAGFSRLEASIAPSALPAPTSVCISSMNRMMPPLDGRHLLQHGLQPLLELAAIFRAGDQRAHVERQQLLVLQALRHVAVDDAQRQAFDDGGLADAGLADQHRIVLGAARQHLDGAADFLVAADHRIELAVARGLRSGRGRISSARHRRSRPTAMSAVRPLRSASMAALRFCGVTPALARILPASLSFSIASASSSRSTVTKLSPAFSAIFSALSNTPRGRRREIDLAGAAARHLRHLAERRLDAAQAPARELPPERSIRPAARPSGSSSRTFRRCSGVNC